MTVSKGKKLTAFRNFSGHCEYLLLYCGMQGVRSVQDCAAVLYEPANWCYIYINKHNFMNENHTSCSINVMTNRV